MAHRTVVMVVMDGWGIGKKDDSNPIYIQNPKNIDYIKHHFPSGALQASSIAVGLPWNEEGNSEVGHLTLGAGRVIYQHFPRISIAIKNGTFFKNKVLLDAINKAKEMGGAVNYIGILTEGNVHASMEHLNALIKLAKIEGLQRVNLHLFTDGKDGAPKDAGELIDKINAEAAKNEYEGAHLASLGGRYYGMDRDQHWNRTERSYQAILGKAIVPSITTDPREILTSLYEKGLTDEFVEPITIDPVGAVKENDSIIFFNFREDSIRQLVEMFLNPTKYNPALAPLANVHMASFTEYNKNFPLAVAFPPEDVINPLGKVISDHGKTQMRIAETNKYAHVTYFFNGLVEQTMKNEYRVLVPSQNVAHYDEFPEMMAKEITARALEAISERAYDFILINYANSDIVAHTGNYDATLKAVQTIDEQIGKLAQEVLKNNDVMIITSDHGNAERLRDPITGKPETKHDLSPVPVYIVGNEFRRNKSDSEAAANEREIAGIISDVAPTILELMGLPKPAEMTGVSLTRIIR